MQAIIDTPYNVGAFATRLANEGVQTVIRYYNHKNSTRFPEKCLTRAESSLLLQAGLSVAVVYQQRGGASESSAGNIQDFSPAMATRDATAALKHAKSVGQPKDSAIYFGVDHDFYRKPDLDIIRDYFKAVGAALDGLYRVGVYGSGTVCSMLQKAELATLFWLPRSMGWSGSRAFFESNQWTLFQASQDIASPWGGFDYDANQFNPAFADFGQFAKAGTAATTAGAAPAGALPASPFPPVAAYRIIASSGVQLRRGPGTEFASEGALPFGTIVHGLREENGWLLVDTTGDGAADGYMKASLLRAVAGGLPIATNDAHNPYDHARLELAKNIAEVPGARDNPRIVLYHASTSDGPAPDETAWCSSFVNFCVGEAGLIGTRSKWARSWHDQGWGQDVTATPREGDIVVWRRRARGVDGGHVAFFVGDAGTHIRVLGGNQSNKVCITSYPKNGLSGSTRYDLLSIRR